MTNTVSIPLEAANLLPDVYASGWAGSMSQPDPARAIIEHVHEFGLSIDKPTIDALNAFKKTHDRYAKLVADFEPFELTESDLFGKNSAARLTDLAARQIAHPAAQEFADQAIGQAADTVRSAVRANAGKWLAALSDLFASEHEYLYLVDDDAIDSKAEVRDREARRESIASLYEALRKYLGLDALGASRYINGVFIERYELTPEQLRQMKEPTVHNVIELERALAELVANVGGGKPRLYVGSLSEFEGEVRELNDGVKALDRAGLRPTSAEMVAKQMGHYFEMGEVGSS
ncbi:hypothetical protein [Nocardia sp. NPDC051570]|uniref:hypothetical protein n=1 Tax=Nocardia sp. NPDC051570 TaxID=3364324 RepID=UPI00379C09BB